MSSDESQEVVIDMLGQELVVGGAVIFIDQISSSRGDTPLKEGVLRGIHGEYLYISTKETASTRVCPKNEVIKFPNEVRVMRLLTGED